MGVRGEGRCMVVRWWLERWCRGHGTWGQAGAVRVICALASRLGRLLGGSARGSEVKGYTAYVLGAFACLWDYTVATIYFASS